jgi:hypothetical protein
MNEVEKDKIRQAAESNAQRLVDGLAPLYLGRTCPFKSAVDPIHQNHDRARECDGPKCMLYCPLNDDPSKPDKITGGVCGATLGVNQLMQLTQNVDNLTRAMGNFALAGSSRILPPT